MNPSTRCVVLGRCCPTTPWSCLSRPARRSRCATSCACRGRARTTSAPAAAWASASPPRSACVRRAGPPGGVRRRRGLGAVRDPGVLDGGRLRRAGDVPRAAQRRVRDPEVVRDDGERVRRAGLDLPALDCVAVALGYSVESSRVADGDELRDALERGSPPPSPRSSRCAWRRGWRWPSSARARGAAARSPPRRAAAARGGTPGPACSRVGQERALLLGLDALGDRLHLQRAGEVERRAEQAVARSSSGARRRKPRSIFSTSTARSRSRASDEWPVPKSSIARRTPSVRSSTRTGSTHDGSRIATDSVISTIQRRVQAVLGDAPAERLDERWGRRTGAARR